MYKENANEISCEILKEVVEVTSEGNVKSWKILKKSQWENWVSELKKNA